VAATAASARTERRFLPAPSSGAKWALGLGLLGSALLGAAVYGLWLAPEPVSGSTALALVALAAIAGASWMRRTAPPPLRVGELGVTWGEPAEAPRVAWCEIKKLSVVGAHLRLDTEQGLIDVPLVAHARGVARILAEASVRIGSRVDVSPRAHERLPPLLDTDGEIVPAAGLQIAGRKCTASGKSITFESDARLCESCAALYHQSHVPAQCSRCERPLDGSAPSAA
jgi:hypothetical protein